MISQHSTGADTPIYTIARCLNELIVNSNLHDALEKIVEWLPLSLNIDRCYVFKNHITEDSTSLTSIIHWYEEGVTDKKGKDLSYLTNINTAFFPEITEPLTTRRPFQVSTYDDLSPQLSQLMAATELKTLLLTPIFSAGDLWGFIGFGDKFNPRRWKNNEIEMLQSLSAAIGVDIESRELRAELYQRNEIYETSLSTLNELIWEIDLRKKKIKIMGSSSNIGGLKVGEYELEPVKWMERHIHPEDKVKVLNRFSDFLEKEHGAQDEDEYRALANDITNYVWIRSRRTLIRDINGEAAIVVGTTTDITESKLVAIELEKQREQLRYLINNIDDVYAIYDLNKKAYEYVSENVESFFGIRKEEFIQKGLLWKEIVHYEDVSSVERQVEEIIASKGRGEFFYRIITPGGDKKMLLQKISIGSQKESESDKAYIVITDYTTIENAEQSLIESERKFRFISDNVSDFISAHTVEGIFTYASPSALKLTGYTADELVNMNVFDLMHPDDRVMVTNELTRTVKERTEVQITYRFKNKKGRYIWLESYCKPTINDLKRVYSIICSTRDVTEKQALMHELEQSLEKERELNELRSKFISTASHEFRTPLTVIQSGVEIMEMYLQDLPKEKQLQFQKQFTKIQTEVERLQDLMSDVLLLGRADAKRTPFKPKESDLLKFITEIIENYNASIRDRRVVLEVKGRPKKLKFDQKLLGHALDNIISNGFRYSEKENLLLEASFNNETVSISVTDYGIGIPKEDLVNLFQPFYRASNTGEIGGTGLGLAIVKEYIDKHHGSISVESELGSHTTFTITLPLKLPYDGTEAKNIGD